MPAMDHYRRIQLARYILDEKLSRGEHFVYDQNEKIVNFGLTTQQLNTVINLGQPFRTSGCEGYDGQVACNRPFANSRPGPGMRNYPFEPDEADIQLIRNQLYTAEV
jgi:biotin synthase